jgi:hypothetical protein
MCIEIPLAVIPKWPDSGLIVIPCDPRRWRIEAIVDAEVRASIHEPPEQFGESPRRLCIELEL